MNSSAAHEMPMLKTVPTERKRNALEDVTVTLLNNWIVVDGVDVVDNAMLLELILLLSLSLFFFSSNACVYIYIKHKYLLLLLLPFFFLSLFNLSLAEPSLVVSLFFFYTRE